MLCAEASGDRELCAALQEVRSRLAKALELACRRQLGSCCQLLQPQVQRLDKMLVNKLPQSARVMQEPTAEEERLGGRITPPGTDAGSVLLSTSPRFLAQPLLSADDEARLNTILTRTDDAEWQAETPCALQPFDCL